MIGCPDCTPYFVFGGFLGFVVGIALGTSGADGWPYLTKKARAGRRHRRAVWQRASIMMRAGMEPRTACEFARCALEREAMEIVRELS